MHQHLRLTWARFDYSWSSIIAALVAPVSHGISVSPDLSSSHSFSPHASGDTRHGTPARSKRPSSSSGTAGILRGRNGASGPGMSVEDTLVNIRPSDEALINRHHLRCTTATKASVRTLKISPSSWIIQQLQQGQESIAPQATMPSTQLQT